MGLVFGNIFLLYARASMLLYSLSEEGGVGKKSQLEGNKLIFW